MFEPSRELSAMIAAARVAGAGLMKHFRQRDKLVVKEKGPADFVSTADLESQTVLHGELSAAFPSYGFLAEESPRLLEVTQESRFVVDPLDGTTNFLHGIPHFAVAIALERAKEVVAGVVFDPAKDEMFTAELGRGAFCGDVRLRVSAEADLAGAVVGTGVPHAAARHRHDGYLPRLRAVMHEVAGVRRFAAAALDLSYVASGRLEAFFEYGLSRWDIAAASLLVREAGGRVSEPDGGCARTPEGIGQHETMYALDSGDVLATNGHLHERMLSLLRPPRAASPRLLRRRGWRA
jgi:myo-inositol-1(or 4)-monophosphatase